MTQPSPPALQSPLARFAHDARAHCPACNADLTALTSDACPECRQALVLQLGPARPRLFLWLAIVVPLLLGAGVATLFVAITIVRGIRSVPAGRAIFLELICIPAAILAVRYRRRIQRLPVAAGIALIALAVASVIFPVFVFILSV